MKALIFIVTLVNVALCEEVKDFFTFAEKSRFMAAICEKCSSIENNNPRKVQSKLVSALTSFVIENNPSKAIVKTSEAINLYEQKYASSENYPKNIKLLNSLLKIYENAYNETSKDLKNHISSDDFEKWEKGEYEKLKIEANKVISEGQHEEIFRDSFFKDIISKFDGL